MDRRGCIGQRSVHCIMGLQINITLESARSVGQRGFLLLCRQIYDQIEIYVSGGGLS